MQAHAATPARHLCAALREPTRAAASDRPRCRKVASMCYSSATCSWRGSCLVYCCIGRQYYWHIAQAVRLRVFGDAQSDRLGSQCLACKRAGRHERCKASWGPGQQGQDCLELAHRSTHDTLLGTYCKLGLRDCSKSHLSLACTSSRCMLMPAHQVTTAAGVVRHTQAC